MYNLGIQVLLRELPSIPDLDPAEVRRLLTGAWVEAVEQTRLGAVPTDDELPSEVLRRLASALEIHAVFNRDLSPGTVQACAFVAAEALDIALEIELPSPATARKWLFGSTRTFEHIETALLYTIAGYDANASRASSTIDHIVLTEAMPESERALLQEFLEFLGLRSRADPRATVTIPYDAPSGTIARARLLKMMQGVIHDHLSWLRCLTDDWTASRDLVELLALLEPPTNGLSQPAYHPDIYHLGILLMEALRATHGRALRLVPPPDGEAGTFIQFQRQQSQSRPLLWPAASMYATVALPGPAAHAVVNVPTGAGKSAVADLAIAQAISHGWVLYLAPTNALVSQIKRQLESTFGQIPGVILRQFQGGAEYSGTSAARLGKLDDRPVLVMTPEKCSLMLRQNPGEFDDLALCVVDEAHALGEPGARAAVLELVLAETMRWAPNAKLLLLSALVGNASELAAWLESATGIHAYAITTPWRPTRTLRALGGFVREPTSLAAAAAGSKLATLPSRRKNVIFNGDLGLLAGLQGTWKSEEAVDYKLVTTNIQAPLTMTRDGISASGYLNPAAGAVAQALTETGHKTLVFLSRSKHDGFSVANKMTGIPSSDELPEALESLLTMAEYELGVESQIRQLLRKQVAVHSSAMLREEQRASELAFESGLAVTLFATATLGQGLNLPANAVVIAGTEIGYDRTATASEKTARAQNQFLNAIGRAGRAQVAARSMAIVLPNKPVILSDTSSGKVLPQSADFLRHDDASTEIHSQLESLMKSAVEGQIDFDAITPAEAAAFAFLSFSSDRESAGKVLAKSFAAFRSDALNSGIDVAAALGELGQAFIDREGAPEWIAVAAHRAGVTVQRAILLERAIRGTPPPGEVPTSIDAWIEVLILILRSVPLDSLDVVLPRSAFQSTPLASAWSERDSAEGWKSFHFSLGRWVSGRTYADILTTNTQATSSGRGQQDPVPRVIRMIDKGFSHELSMVAGAFLSIVETSIESRDPSAWQLSQPSMHALEQLPTAIRLGVDSDASLAWLQLGFRPRRVARLMTQLFPAPDSLTPAELRRWIRTKSSAIRLQDLEGILDAKDRRVISAVVSTRTYVDPLP